MNPIPCTTLHCTTDHILHDTLNEPQRRFWQHQIQKAKHAQMMEQLKIKNNNYGVKITIIVKIIIIEK